MKKLKTTRNGLETRFKKLVKSNIWDVELNSTQRINSQEFNHEPQRTNNSTRKELQAYQ